MGQDESYLTNEKDLTEQNKEKLKENLIFDQRILRMKRFLLIIFGVI